MEHGDGEESHVMLAGVGVAWRRAIVSVALMQLQRWVWRMEVRYAGAMINGR